MDYVIRTGRFETGTAEQQQGYVMLFGGEDIRYFFDLYFHWYNIVHELGHCIVETQGAKMSGVEEEMYVNTLAVAYYRYVGDTRRLGELEKRLLKILGNIPSPIGEGETFTQFYERIWNTEQINDVMIYGYFQLRSVLEALKDDLTLGDVLKRIGVSISDIEAGPCEAEIKSSSAEVLLKRAMTDLAGMGLDVPDVRVKLEDDPMIQCARPAGEKDQG